MTQTQLLRKRMTRTLTAPNIDMRTGRAPRSCETQAADLAQALRSVVLRAHQAVKHHKRASHDHPVSSQTLHDLQTDIHRLQSEFDRQGLHSLAAYATALGRQVRSRLG